MENFQNFQTLFKKLKFLRKFLQNFILCREIPGRSKIYFWRDFQQILKKHKGTSTLCRAAQSGKVRQSAAKPRGKSCAMPQVYVDVVSAWLRHAVRCCAT